jgi:hypothetical protein
MQTDCTDTAFSTGARFVPSQSALGQIVSTSEEEVVENGDTWMQMSSSEQSIWPRVWPGL